MEKRIFELGTSRRVGELIPRTAWPTPWLCGRKNVCDWLNAKNRMENTKTTAKGRVQTERFEAKHKSEDEIGRFTPSDWSKRQKEAQETSWARFRFRF